MIFQYKIVKMKLERGDLACVDRFIGKIPKKARGITGIVATEDKAHSEPGSIKLIVNGRTFLQIDSGLAVNAGLDFGGMISVDPKDTIEIRTSAVKKLSLKYELSEPVVL